MPPLRENHVLPCLPNTPIAPEASKALQLALQKALIKQASSADALNEAAATWTELMK